MSVRVRFAPSPTGKLHIGNIRAALINWLFARQQQGVFVLRIDDTDKERSTTAYEEAIRRDLSWLGLTWDETFKQSERFDRYNEVVEKLKADGRLYPAYETADELDLKRKIQLGRGLPPVYDRAALELSADEIAAYEAEGRKPHWRFKLDVPATVAWTDLIRGDVSVDMASVSDPILIREDGSFLYTLPSVIDDIDYGISHIVRGEDHVTNSAVQVQIFEAVGGTAPAMAHFALMTGKTGEKLSKRTGSLSMEEIRDELGLEALAVVVMLAKLGTSEPVQPFADVQPLLSEFAFSKFSRAATRFDPDELTALNTKILHKLPFEAVSSALPADVTADVWSALQGNIDKLGDISTLWQLIAGPISPVIENPAHISTCATLLPEGELGADSWKVWTDAIKAETGVKGRDLFMPLRLALTGQKHGPDMAEILPMIGRAKTLSRLAGEAS